MDKQSVVADSHDNGNPGRQAVAGRNEIPAETLLALKLGDHGAFDKVYKSYYKPLKDFLVVLTRSDNDAHDIAQRVFMEMWEKRDRIDPAKNKKGL